MEQEQEELERRRMQLSNAMDRINILERYILRVIKALNKEQPLSEAEISSLKDRGRNALGGLNVRQQDQDIS